jgi:hypothetical protein
MRIQNKSTHSNDKPQRQFLYSHQSQQIFALFVKQRGWRLAQGQGRDTFLSKSYEGKYWKMKFNLSNRNLGYYVCEISPISLQLTQPQHHKPTHIYSWNEVNNSTIGHILTLHFFVNKI